MTRGLHVVGAAILDPSRPGRCLAAQRAPHVASPGLWEFPGGKVEDGETPEAALVREIREELDLSIVVEGWLGRGEARPGGRHVVLDVYLARRLAGTPKLTDHQRIRWIDADGIHRLRWADADVPALAALESILRAGPKPRAGVQG
ncbi:MAG: (deoxy)nucleoside triphosphate pyrophosphohydrolase [Acidobacteriota bacterium]